MPSIVRFLMLGVAIGSATVAAQSISYPQLVNRMTDLRELARLPAPGERTALASSYDRASVYDAATGKYLHWDANGDSGGFVRREGDNLVLMDVQGPGVIWRMWTADALLGHMKIYLDGAQEPTIDLPFVSYFDGSTAPFNRPNLVYAAVENMRGSRASGKASGWDNYTPISFGKSCKIVVEKDWGRYYHFNYTLFPTGTKIPTFRMDISEADSAALNRANEILGKSGQPPSVSSKAKTENHSITIAPHTTSTIFDLKGSGAIAVLKVKLDLPKDSEAERVLLRQLTLSINWDGEASPAVWSPLGDFFGFVGGADVFQSYPVGLLEDGTFYSYWYMPYGKGARIEAGNDGDSPVSLQWTIVHEPLSIPLKDLGRFHAKWHRNAFLPKTPDRGVDWTLLTTTGRGRFVGTHLHGWNPRQGWWGEGDEKFFIDGEKFPSTFGTGTEDYFGFGWSEDLRFSRPYHDQILNEGNQGHFDDNRWHISDSVPFQKSFEGSIEKYYADDRSTLYAAEAFWYLAPGGVDPYLPVSLTERIGYWVRPKIFTVPGVIEGEDMGVVVRPAEYSAPQDMYRYGPIWSGERHFFWPGKNVGESLGLRPPHTQKAGKYHLFARFTYAPDYGIFQANFDGKDVGQPIDLYSPKLVAGAEIDLGMVSLDSDSRPIFKVTITGKNEAATDFHFGLDYLKLDPIP